MHRLAITFFMRQMSWNKLILDFTFLNWHVCSTNRARSKRISIFRKKSRFRSMWSPQSTRNPNLILFWIFALAVITSDKESVLWYLFKARTNTAERQSVTRSKWARISQEVAGVNIKRIIQISSNKRWKGKIDWSFWSPFIYCGCTSTNSCTTKALWILPPPLAHPLWWWIILFNVMTIDIPVIIWLLTMPCWQKSTFFPFLLLTYILVKMSHLQPLALTGPWLTKGLQFWNCTA